MTGGREETGKYCLKMRESSLGSCGLFVSLMSRAPNLKAIPTFGEFALSGVGRIFGTAIIRCCISSNRVVSFSLCSGPLLAHMLALGAFRNAIITFCRSALLFFFLFLRVLVD